MIKFCKELSLAYLNPKLSKEWDYEKNYPLTPSDVRCGSNKRVGWLCKSHHKWDALIFSRMNGSGCPYCSDQKVCIDNCLATLNPELARQWHPTKNGKLTPCDVVCGSHKMAWWECEKKHEWFAIIRDRVLGKGCPYCSGNRVNKYNCLATLNPILAKEWDYKGNGKLTPQDVTQYSGKKVGWQCKKGHKWRSIIYNRSKGQNCPFCTGHKAHINNCLAILNPKIASEWHPTKNGNWTPYDVTVYSNRYMYWLCNKGHEYGAVISNRSSGDDCPYCHKIELKNGFFCDSKPEAYYCQKLDDKGIKFKHHVKIGLGKCTCDFYIPSTNRYIEVTGYKRDWKYWPKYYKNILRKKHHITKVLKAKFKLVQLNLTRSQIQYVRENSI